MSFRFLSISFVLICGLFGAAFGQCPSIRVVGPAGITMYGEPAVFRAEVDVSNSNLQFAWTVSAGTIIEGQGTTQISVATDRSIAGKSMTAKVEVGGLPSACEKIASDTALIAPAIADPYFDDWSDMLKPNDVRVRLDAHFTVLLNNPKATGFLILRVRDKERLDAQNKRLQLIVKHAKFRGFDVSRIWFQLERAEEGRTSLLILTPEQKNMFKCSDWNCLIIKGGHLR